MKRAKGTLLIGVILLVVFAAFTYLVSTVDVRPVGPENSLVGFANINKSFFDAVGGNSFCYYLTEVYGYLSLLIMAGFAVYGLYELIKGKSFKAVDGEIWCLAAFYVVVLAFYVFFEKCVINCRPIIEDAAEGLEASYPSSHTVLIISVMGSTSMVLTSFFKGVKSSRARAISLACDVIIITAIIGRLLAGVHWLTDIVGGLILAFALLFIFNSALGMINAFRKARKNQSFS